MAIQRLSVNIGANVGGAVTGINQVNKSLNKLAPTAQKSTKNFTDFSRVIQDLPFGLVGIQNNLTQLIPGVGALGLAFSAIISALTFAQIGFGAWTKGLGSASEKAKDHAKAVKENREALNDYVDALEDVRGARVRGAQDAQRELVELKALYDATQNVNIPIAKRKQLVDDLQEQYPKYFGNIRDEVILAGGAKKAYDELTTAILASARARAAQDTLVEIQKEVLAIEEQQVDAVKEIEKANTGLLAVQKKTDEAATRLAQKGLAQSQVLQTKVLQDAEEKYGDAVEASSELQQKKNKLLERAARISQNITVVDDPGGKVDKIKTPKLDPIKLGLRYDLAGDLNVDKTVVDLFKRINEATKAADAPSEFEKSFQDKLKKSLEKPIPARINIAPLMTPETESAAEKLGTDIGKIIAQSVAPGFSSFGESIGQAIAAGENPIAAAGASILTTIGDLISQIGKALIEYGVVKEGLDKILIGGIAIPGVAAIGLGVAAVAIGALIKSSFQKTKKFAEGGLVFGPTMGMVGEGVGTTRSNPEVVAPLDKLKKFIGGGNNFPEYLPAHRVTGDELLMWYKRSNKKGGRHE